MIDLRADLLETVKAVLVDYVGEAEVWAFGSRVTMTAKDYSDLDLVVVGKEKLPQRNYYHLKDAFEESDLPIRVEVLDWHRISLEFQNNIRKKYEVILKRK